MNQDTTMKRILIAATAALLLAGCASGPQHYQKQGGGTQLEFNRDIYDCEREMRQYSFGWGLAASLDAGEFKAKCIAAHGWVRS